MSNFLQNAFKSPGPKTQRVVPFGTSDELASRSHANLYASRGKLPCEMPPGLQEFLLDKRVGNVKKHDHRRSESFSHVDVDLGMHVPNRRTLHHLENPFEDSSDSGDNFTDVL